MNSQTDEAVVLRLTEYSETSQIATLFGAEHGLIRVIAKGARRSTKQRFAAGLDLLELGAVSYVPPRGDAQLGTLTEWGQRDTFLGLRRELVRLQGGLYAVELVNGLTEEGDPHPDLFQALLKLLHGLAGDEPAGPLVPRFQYALLAAIGYAPELRTCTVCGRLPRAGQPTFFSAGTGGLVCRDCEPHQVEKRRMPRRVSGPAVAADDVRAWFDLLDYHLTHIAGRRFKTASVLATLLASVTPGPEARL